MALGKPAINTPRPDRAGQVDQRGLQQAVDQIRERFAGVESAIKTLQDLVGSNQTFEAIDLLKQQIASLAKKIAALDTTESIALIDALLQQPNGLVVLKDGTLITRVLQPGEGIVIQYADGSVSGPLIKLQFPPIDPLPLAGNTDAGWQWADDALGELIE